MYSLVYIQHVFILGVVLLLYVLLHSSQILVPTRRIDNRGTVVVTHHRFGCSAQKVCFRLDRAVDSIVTAVAALRFSTDIVVRKIRRTSLPMQLT